MKGKHRYLSCFMLLMISLLSFWLFRQIYFRVLLCREVTDLTEEWKLVTENSSVLLVSEIFSNAAGYTADAQVSLKQPGEKNTVLDFKIRSKNHCYRAEGHAFTGEEENDFIAYWDQDMIAVSSALFGGGFYGITFDTFTQDIQSIPMISWIFPDNTIQKWNASLQKIKYSTGVLSFYDVPELKWIHSSDLSKILMVMPAQIAKTKICVNGKAESVTRIVYELDTAAIPESVKSRIAIRENTDINITACFYLQQNELAMADISIDTEKQTVHFSLEKRGDNKLLSFTTEDRSVSAEFIIGDEIAENWNVLCPAGNEETQINMNWSPHSNKMTISNGTDLYEICLERKGDGIFADIQDLRSLFALLGQEIQWNASCSVSVEKDGGDLQKPIYKNLDQWSFEDFLILLDGISTMIGWEF